MKLIKLKRSDKAINLSFLGEDGTQVSFKINTDELNGEVKKLIDQLAEKWYDFAENKSNIIGFSINTKSPESVVIEIGIAIGGMLFTAKSEKLEIKAYYDKVEVDIKSINFVDFYNFIQNEFENTLYRFVTQKMPEAYYATQFKLFGTE